MTCFIVLLPKYHTYKGIKLYMSQIIIIINDSIRLHNNDSVITIIIQVLFIIVCTEILNGKFVFKTVVIYKGSCRLWFDIYH